VGDAGQARLAAGVAVVRGDTFAAEVEARYLAGAGVGTLVVTSARVAEAARDVDAAVVVRISEPEGNDLEAPRELALESPEALALASGAYRALVRVRELLAGPAS